MGRAVEKWIADDGSEFGNKRDMIVHEMTILDEKEIDYFVTSIIQTSVKRTSEYKKLLMSWQKHVRTQQFEEPVQLELPLSPSVLDPFV